MYGRVRSITADHRTATVDYIQKDGTISTVTAKQYPDTDVPAEEGEAVLFQQFSNLEEANHAGTAPSSSGHLSPDLSGTPRWVTLLSFKGIQTAR